MLKKFLVIIGFLFSCITMADSFEVTAQPLKNTFFYMGSLEPAQKQVLESPAKGIIKELSIHYGSRISKGKVLWKIESSELEARIRETEAANLEAEQRLQGLLQWAERPEVQQLRQQVHRAETNLKRLKNRSQQTEKLFEAGIVSRDERDQDIHAAEDAEEWLEESQISFAQLQKNYNERAVKIAELQAENTSKHLALLHKKRAQLMPIVPFEGILLPPPPATQQLKEPVLVLGAKVQEDQVLGILVKEGAYKIELFVDETELSQLSVGLPVCIQLQALPDRPLTGRVAELHFYPSHEASSNAVSHYLVQVTLDHIPNDLNGKLYHGMKVLVTVEVGDERGILSVPKTALFFKGSNVFVRLKKRAHWVEQPIKIGRHSTERIEVLDGLSVGDKIANPYSSE